MKKLFSFRITSITIIFPFIIPICFILRSIVMHSFKEKYKNVNISLIFIPLIYLGESLNFILALIVYIRKNESKWVKEYVEIENKKKTIYIENSMVPIQRKFKKNILIKFLILLLIIILDTSSMTYKYVILTDITIDTQFLTISQIIFVGILSKYIIKHPFKKHHYISVTLVIIGIIFIILSPNVLNIEKSNIKFFLILFLFSFFTALQEVLEKYLMHYEYITPFHVVFYEGCFGLCFVFFIFLFCLICNNKLLEESFYPCLKEFIHIDLLNFFLFISFVLLSFGANTTLMLTNFYYSPSHRSISDSIEILIIWINNVIFEFPNLLLIIVNFIGFIFIIFGVLVYNEILICHFFNLDSQTKVEISLRGESEVNKIIDEQDEEKGY